MAGVVIEGTAEDQRTAYVHHFQTLYKGFAAAAVGAAGAGDHRAGGLIEKIRQARIRAALSVNTELLTTYWEIGTAIIQQQKKEGWGSKIVDNLVTLDLNSQKCKDYLSVILSI